MRYTKLLYQNRTWLMLALSVAVLSTAIVFAPSLQAAALDAADPPSLEQSQIFNDDLQVGADQVLDGDVVVYQGDVTVEQGGVIRGNLIVYNGDIEVEEGGVVEGDITAFSGDVTIDGVVKGSITSLSGDVELQDNAVVSGDISVFSGELRQDRGAVVEGSVLRGPAIQLNLPAVPVLGALPGAPIAPVPPQAPSATELIFGFLWRVIRGLLALALAVGVGVLMVVWRPDFVRETRAILIERTALSFATGLIFNLFGLALIGILWASVCFRPPGLLLGLLFAGANLVGLAVTGDEIGRRLGERLGVRWSQPWPTIAGIVVPGAVVVFLWILGGCFGFFAFLGGVILTSFGVGAILVKLLNLGEPSPAVPAPITTPDSGQRAASAPVEAAPVEAAPVEAAPVEAAPVEAAPVEAAPVEAASVEPWKEAVEPVAEAPVREIQVDALAASGVSDAAEVTASAPDAAPAPVTAAPVPDDFTQIAGIGPVFDQRLKDAGILTFAELAARTPDEIAGIVKWSTARVEKAELIEQARRLASNG